MNEVMPASGSPRACFVINATEGFPEHQTPKWRDFTSKIPQTIKIHKIHTTHSSYKHLKKKCISLPLIFQPWVFRLWHHGRCMARLSALVWLGYTTCAMYGFYIEPKNCDGIILINIEHTKPIQTLSLGFRMKLRGCMNI